MPKRKNQTE